MKNKIETVVMHQQGNSPHRIFIIQTKKNIFHLKMRWGYFHIQTSRNVIKK